MKKSTKKITLLILVFAITSVMFGCHGGSSSDPNQGFTVKGVARVYNLQGTQFIDYATSGRYQGLFLSGAGTYGSLTSFDEYAGILYNARGAKVPGRWRIGLSRGFDAASLCVSPAVEEVNVSLGSVETIRCFGGTSIFVSQPDTVDAFNPPSTITITGSGIEDTYGMPKIAIYDEYGNVGASVTATQTLAGGIPHSGPGIEALTFNAGDLSQVYDGVYSITVSNVNADGSWAIVGGAIVSVYGNPPPPPDPDPGGGDCEPQPQGYEQLPCDDLLNQ